MGFLRALAQNETLSGSQAISFSAGSWLFHLTLMQKKQFVLRECLSLK